MRSACQTDDSVTPPGGAVSCHTVPEGIAETAAVALAVNPEARVYATVEQHAVHRGEVGEPIELPVAVLNTGYVTAPITAVLTAPTDGSVSLSWRSDPLTGADREDRVLGITAHALGYADVTISFGFPGEPFDLGGRDRIHLLVRVGGDR